MTPTEEDALELELIRLDRLEWEARLACVDPDRRTVPVDVALEGPSGRQHLIRCTVDPPDCYALVDVRLVLNGRQRDLWGRLSKQTWEELASEAGRKLG